MGLWLSSALAASVLMIGTVVPPSPIHAETALADIVLVQEGDRLADDLYAVGNRVVIEGTVAGDLVVAAGELQITGRVDGDVLGLVGRAVIGGEVGGSVRMISAEMVTDGDISEDLVFLVGSGRLNGGVGRNVLAFGDEVSIRGRIGRDLRGRTNALRLNAQIGRSVDVTVQGSQVCGLAPGLEICRESGLVVEPGTRVGGNLAYRSPQQASLSGAAEIEGRVIRRRPGPANVRMRALQRVISILWFLAFVVTGLVLLALLSNVSADAIEAAVLRILVGTGLGLLVLLLLPVLALAAALTVVGLPIGLVILAVWLLLLFVGPVPAVAAIGHRILGGRTGRFGAFVMGVLIWGLLRIIPVVGGLVYLFTLLWGTGAWTFGLLARRRTEVE